MKRIAIVTLDGYFNHGNRLQNYALQTYLESRGFKVESLRIDRNTKYSPRKVMSKLKKFVLNTSKYITDIDRSKKFKRFTKDNIKESRNIYYINDDLSYLNEEFDFFVAGSDQVWNPYMNKKSGKFFLDFADEEKRISYAASFGISELTSECENTYQKLLKKLKHISVREEEGKNIVQKLTGKDVPVLLDPTLLLSYSEWMKVASKPENLTTKKYMLVYFLGNASKDQMNHVSEIARSKNLEIVDVGNSTSKYYNCGPSEFLYLIANSDLFLTDSFHGAVFSIIFSKEFFVFERQSKKSMNSRLETLLTKFSLEPRAITIDSSISDVKIINYQYINRILIQEQKKTDEFFSNIGI